MKRNARAILAAILSLSLVSGVVSGCSDTKSNESESTTAATTAEQIDESVAETTKATEATEVTEATTKETETPVEDLVPTINPKFEGKTAEEIVEMLTLEEKAAQMVQGVLYNIDYDDMQVIDYGSILSTTSAWPAFSDKQWTDIVNEYQENALLSSAGIPYIYGNDSVHGVNTASGCVIFPHNINIGAANDVDLTYEMGVCVGSDILHTRMLMNFGPCVAAAQDPRWGRTYESYSSEPSIITPLAVAFSQGQLNQGVIVCAKHFICDGYALYGTGENGRLIDRGDAVVSDEIIEENLAIYQALIDEGVQMIMLSHSALNGIKMHENLEYVQYIKDEMGFEGVIISDWESLDNCSGATLEENVILCINAGTDLLMEADHYDKCVQIIIDAVNNGDISMERIDDACTRIIRLKLETGYFDDPYLENINPAYEYGSDYSKEVAKTLAQESLVPLKMDGGLTIEPGSKVFVMGPAAKDVGAMCGGWTTTWQGMSDDAMGSKWILGANTILDALNAKADEYDLTILTNPSKMEEADVILLCVGEYPYAEWEGDTEDLSLTGLCGLEGNEDAINQANEAREAGIPVITLIVAGRNVLVSDYIDQWDSAIMCYLPGTEGGNAIASMLMGEAEYTGKLPMPYYKSVEDIEAGNVWLPVGFSAN